MAKILIFGPADWNHEGKDLGYKNLSSYAKQLALQGHQVSWTCSLRRPLNYVQDTTPGQRIVGHTYSWSEFDIVCIRALAKDLPKEWLMHYAFSKANLRPDQKLFWQVDDVEMGRLEPTAHDLMAWGFTKREVNAYLYQPIHGIISDHSNFDQMAFACALPEHLLPGNVPWYWNAQCIWDWVESEPQQVDFAQEKTWSVGYCGFYKQSRVQMLQYLLDNRPDDISFAAFGPIASNIDFKDFGFNGYIMQDQLAETMGQVWTTPYLVNNKTPGKLNTRLFESLASNVTVFVPNAGLPEALNPWAYRDASHLHELIRSHSFADLADCQKGLANEIANWEWQKSKHLGWIPG